MTLAMKDAGITSPADVHFVQIKCPLLTKERIEEATRRGQKTATEDTYHSMALSRGASALGVALAHAVTGLPYVVLTVSASLANLDPRLEQASRGLGASLGQTLRYVIVPNIVPGVLSGAIFAFIHSCDELVVVLFIGGRALFTLPRRMWDGINDNLDPVIAVVATGMILFTLLVLTAELSLRKRRTT